MKKMSLMEAVFGDEEFDPSPEEYEKTENRMKGSSAHNQLLKSLSDKKARSFFPLEDESPPSKEKVAADRIRRLESTKKLYNDMGGRSGKYADSLLQLIRKSDPSFDAENDPDENDEFGGYRF